MHSCSRVPVACSPAGVPSTDVLWSAEKRKMQDGSSAPQIIEHLTYSTAFTPFEARWIPASARFIVAGSFAKGTGAIQVFGMEGTEIKKLAETEKKIGIKCCTFGASLFETRSLATGDHGGFLNLWDIENMEKSTFCVKAHSLIVNCIDGCGGQNIGFGAPELVTGSRDGCVKVWDPRVNEPVASLEPASGQSPRFQEVWGYSTSTL